MQMQMDPYRKVCEIEVFIKRNCESKSGSNTTLVFQPYMETSQGKDLGMLNHRLAFPISLCSLVVHLRATPSVLFCMQYGADLVSTVVTAAGAGMTGKFTKNGKSLFVLVVAMTVAFVKMVRQW